MSQRFRAQDLPLSGLRLIERLPLRDPRGFLERLYCSGDFAALGLPGAPVQINHTLTRRRGAVRGMHVQTPPHAEVKFVSCLRGEVFDVAVDLRRGSPTFLHWHGERLSPDNSRTLYIPAGFAHGFQTLSEDCEMLYFHSAAYAPDAEGGVSPREPRINIAWPLEITELSPRDAAHPPLAADYAGVKL
jgi:dTDP-4-dehydrorhamnose 3,5-epimerase